MDERDWLTERFEEHRHRLGAVAYRMLGSRTEADDAVQEAWVRLNRADTSGVENLGGWLTTIVARVCLDMLRSRESRREHLVDDHVPESIAVNDATIDPEHEALLGDSVGLAMLVVLQTLAPRSGSPSSCTTCSPCPSTRSLPSWAARPRRRA